jgi:hypothetical protein
MTTHVFVGLLVLLIGCGNNHGNLDARVPEDDSALDDGGSTRDLPGRDFTHEKGVETFSANQYQPTGIAVDDQHVYWATPSAVMRKRKSGGKAETLAGSFVHAEQLALDEHGVFVVELVHMPDYAVKRIDKQTRQVTVIAAADPFVSGVDVDGENVYWACLEAVGPIDDLHGQIRSRDRQAKGPARTLFKGFGVHLGFSHVTARPEQCVCWTAKTAVRCGLKDGSHSWAVAEVPSVDLGAHDIVDLGFPKMLAWTNLDTTSKAKPGNVQLYDKGVSFTGQVRILADNLARPFQIATDGNYLYWTDPREGALHRTAIAQAGVGPQGSTLLTEDAASADDDPKFHGPYDVAVDEHHVYWTNRYDGTVKRMPK